MTFPNTHTNATRFFAVSFCLVTTQLIVISLALTAFKKKLCGWNLLPSKNFTITSNYFLDFPSFFLRSGIAMIFTLSFSREKLSTDTRKIPSKTFVSWFTYGCAIYCWQPSWKKGNFLWRLFSSFAFEGLEKKFFFSAVLAQHPLK